MKCFYFVYLFVFLQMKKKFNLLVKNSHGVSVSLESIFSNKILSAGSFCLAYGKSQNKWLSVWGAGNADLYFRIAVPLL